MITKECGGHNDRVTRLQLNELGNIFLLAHEKSKLCKMVHLPTCQDGGLKSATVDSLPGTKLSQKKDEDAH